MPSAYGNPYVGGDLNAWVAFVGFILGVATGVFALKKGFSLGRAHVTNKVNGAVLPAIVVAILILATCTTLLKASQAGPGSMHAPIIASLIGVLYLEHLHRNQECALQEVSGILS